MKPRGLWYWELRHWFKYFGNIRLNRPKSPVEVFNTIQICGFGVDNYTFKNGHFKRKKGR